MESLAKLREVGAEVQRVHECYFPVDRAKKRVALDTRLTKVNDLVGAIDLAALNASQKAEVAYIIGKAKDATPEFSPEAENQLEKAVKLDPAQLDAWYALAHCKQKKRDLAGAKACVDRVLSADSTHLKAMQLRSMLLRQLAAGSKQQSELLKASVEAASAAITLNFSDPFSWSLLGSAYLSVFFATSHDPDDLVKARKAYTRASQLDTASSSPPSPAATDSSKECSDVVDVSTLVMRYPDAHFNRGVVCMFQEDYLEAIEAFKTAKDLDSAMEIEGSLETMFRHARKMQEICNSYGGLRKKTLKELTASLTPDSTAGLLNTAAAKAALEGRCRASVAELTPGVNKGKYVVLKMLVPVSKSEQPPASCAMVDEHESAVGVSAYHLSEAALGRLTQKDTVVVLDPLFKVVELPADTDVAGDGSKGSIVYRSILVMKPSQMLVNGKPTATSYAQMEMTATAFDS